jgi:uncharacterized protein
VASLLDVNVLVALAWPNHVHHAEAHAWFGSGGRGPWATSSVTQAGFVRVSSNPSVLASARTPREALALLRTMTELPGHEFWPDATNLVVTTHLREQALTTYRRVTDAHLLALALERRGTLVTFDRGLRALLPEGAAPQRLVILSGGPGVGPKR